MSYYSSILLLLHNISIAVILISVYTTVCIYVARERRRANCRIDRMEIQLFLTILCICASTTTCSLLYVYINYVDSPSFLIIIANVVWQLSHGIHGIVYMIMNQQIRRGVCLLLTRRKADTKNSSVGSWVKTHKKENENSNKSSI
ncbi:hypothetical protein NECAME_04752 [Necator americanus]|uniref:7TM GPCR serpentine receptor class x (Srx) domain-containing protein n=1 Tax=Necator americanus TaxID=51031 RepID=W2SPW4_NECAM|nr:hypothetical protein NECAME_04752 [Necator americanus]ETN70901.1 hypothetical protein NECAME_04752 [Necator americanus]